ncbi:invasin domain 3-containing protein [Candidatus Thioglobus autotrophicus]|uniref:invasin domain 3-containing protein n=1 Tax=Candidatus Thioglobus autotrophicus TaxID=1705394 RepID=UPI00299EE097|nr:invasin domain 3-containing protein [Candidatus Thioglobus autotrophicus]WPE16789.1 invasin domain 3-containing protein [Candidatus Thioglobus autotrophicus]
MMKTLLKNIDSTHYNATNLITHIAVGARSSVLSKLKHFLAFGALTLSLNVTSTDVNQFNKEAYINLNQEYTYNNQVVIKEEDAFTAFFTEIFSSIRSALGGTDSDNANQLGNKITNSLENKATNKIDSLINTKINELANSVGNGKTEISVHQIESKDPTYSIKTIQPLTELNDDSTRLTFIQAQLNSGENHGERRDTINLGIGQRYLLEGGQSIAGINLFTDYETESKHKRASLGLEYQRANFTANINKYYPLTDKKVIGDYTEEALAGHDIKLSGQAPYLPWAKIKGTHYYWDAKVGDNIKGTILGVEIELNPSTTLEIGTENSNTAERASYARLSAQLPFKDGEAFTNFKVADQAFANLNIVTLTDLDFAERSNKIRIEKLLNGVSVVLGEYNAPTTGSTCTLYNASNVAIANGSGVTGADGSVTLSNVVLATGLVSISCNAIGTYTDEATGVTTTSSPVLRAAKIYSGTGNLTLLASPLSEIAYQLASGDLAKDITTKNTNTATAFGISGVDFTATIPTNLNTTAAANDDAGKFGTVLAAVSQMSENAGHDDTQPTANNGGDNIHANETIQELVVDMADGVIDGVVDTRGSNKVDVVDAINNLESGSTGGSGGANNNNDGNAKNNTNATTGEGSIKGNLAISVISSYTGSGTAPTMQQYVDAGVTGVNSGNLAEVNSQIASASSINSDTTAEIQSIVDNTPTAATVANSIVTASPTSVAADGSTTSTITMQAKDANNNNLSTGGLTVTMTESGSATLSSVTDNGNGTYTATITSTTAETVTVTAAFGGSNVTDTADVTFSATAATVANSIVTASPTSVAADGSTTSTITMQAKDANNNNLSTGGLTVTMTESGSATLSSVTDNGNGTYTATITSTTAETVTVTAAFGGSNVTDTADVTFTVYLASITIGSQTWSASNVSLVPTTYNTLGTDYWNAYSGSGSAADDDGYYYTWDAAMNVCPSGWSLPSDSDWKVLEGQLGMSAVDQDATGWRGTDEGTKLKVGGSSGFEAKLAGYRNTNGNFYTRGDYTFLWSSTESGSNAYRRFLNTSNATVYRVTVSKAHGFSVRCLKD